ncbi:PilN domain-containing protein [Aidingimonas lacisalsi]|uniref:PilN domain-containing protein n=1 Tax=Aidingimonas lacisalsi TaxID=2604086 RepID=UPI00137562FB|nr:PilN domain-containing protein [Aidingimonas lacisalsi]
MTVAINLLPWRAERRARRAKRFHRMLISVVTLGALLAGSATLHLRQALSAQERRNVFIEARIERLDRDIRRLDELEREHQRIQAQIDVLTRLQFRRPHSVRIVNQLTASLQEGVYYRHLSRRDGALYLAGVASNDAQVSEQLRALAKAPVFDIPELSAVESGSGGERRFELKITERRSPWEGLHAPEA